MAEKTVTIGWGRPTIKVKKVSEEDTAYKTLPTPMDGTTTLETTQGDKMEAKIEGGENEAVKYKANTYELTFKIRHAPEKQSELDVISDTDGVVAEEYSVQVIPENEEAIGVEIARASVNVQTSFDTTDGVVKTYTFSALKNDKGKTVEFKKIQASEAA